MAQIPRRYIDNYTKSLNKLSADAQAKLAADLAKIDFTVDVATIREAVIARMEFYCGPYANMAAILAANFYDGLREISVGKKLGALAESGREPIATERAVRGIMQDVVDGKPEVAVGKLVSRADYEIKKSAGECVYRNGKRDPLKPKYARVPSGGETCRFCIMLASRGFVYHSEEAAGENSHYHANCDCRIVPGFAGKTTIPGYDPDLYYDMWKHPEKYANQGATAPTSQPAPPVSAASIKRTASVYSTLDAKHVDAISDIVTRSNNAVSDIYLMFEDKLNLINGKHKGGAHFTPTGVGVNMDVDKTFNDLKRSKMGTWFHEFGHHIDYLVTGDEPWLKKRLWNNSYISYAYQNNLFGRTLQKEVNDIIDAKHTAAKVEAKALLDNLDVDGLIAKDYIKVYGNSGWYRDIVDHIDDPDWFISQGFNPKDVKTLAGRKKVFAREVKGDYHYKRRVSKQGAYEAMEQELRALPDIERCDISDIFEGATKGKVQAGWGHGKSYWKDDSNLPSEAFAEFFSAYTANPDSLKVLQRYLPDSMRVFDNIIDDILKGVV